MQIFGTLGFSIVGLFYLLMLFIPNSFWAKHQPKDYDPTSENRILLLFERSGQVLCTTALLVFSDTTPKAIDLWILWLVLSFILMLIYLGFWWRYFRGNQTMTDFYRPLLKIPFPGATLPVIAFFLLGIYARMLFLIGSTIILGIGHIGIHYQHWQEIEEKNEDITTLRH